MEGPPREFGTLKSRSENGEGRKRHIRRTEGYTE